MPALLLLKLKQVVEQKIVIDTNVYHSLWLPRKSLVRVRMLSKFPTFHSPFWLIPVMTLLHY